ncbi:hypothetical protein [Flavobacterium agrisoli]|uniref:DUF2946 domain-containing protein n=1 Tax=Flavobacterium agrisoli TaxID=2793066 RepID=A0A934PJI9_9FLAO|nr:hypothetical protein [Flavobacterium agrisoli]MBK0369296.1 hypothetical protein [Flavobacterium agrisoli]
MKNKQLILSFTLAVTVLFSILFQSIHSYEHLKQQLAQVDCHHHYNTANHTEITHKHHAFEMCSVCHFSFSYSVAPQDFSFQVLHFQQLLSCAIIIPDGIISFSGSSYSLRGPPVIA